MITYSSIPSIDIIIPNCETVENARIPFKSCCFVAFNEAQNSVIKPTKVIVHIHPSDTGIMGLNVQQDITLL